MTLRYVTLHYVALHYVTLHLTIACQCFWETQVAVLWGMFVSALPGALSLFKIVLGMYENQRFAPCLQKILQLPYSIFTFHLSVQTWCLGGRYPRRTSDLHFDCDLHFDKFDFPGELAHCTNCRHDEGVGLEPPNNSSTCSGHAETQTSQTSQTSSRLFLVV